MSKNPRKKKHAMHGANRQWAESVARRTGAIVQDMPLPEGKISDIVVSFAEPLMDAFVESDEDQVEVLTFACLLWNLAFIRESDRKLYAYTETQVMAVLSGTSYFLGPAQALNLLTAMMKRWDQDFSWCRRMIVEKRIVIEKPGSIYRSYLRPSPTVMKLIRHQVWKRLESERKLVKTKECNERTI